MKKGILLLLAFVLVASTVVSCKKDGNKGTAGAYMDATISGSGFHTLNCKGSLNGTQLSIAGFVGDEALDGAPGISFLINSFSGAGTYTIGSAGNSGNYLKSLAYASSAATGTISITAVSPYSGTFSFVCADGTVISGGRFTTR